MDFELSEDQVMLRDSIARYLTERYTFAARGRALVSPLGWRMECWRDLARELGVLGAPFAESAGGLGGGPVENMIVMEEFGRCLVLEPYFATVVLGGGFLKHGGGARASELIAGIIRGDVVIAFAHAEVSRAGDAAEISTTATRRQEGYVLDGAKTLVRAAPGATHFLVSARSADAGAEVQSLSVFIVEAQTPGVTMQSYPTFDGRRAADIHFHGVAVSADALIGEGDHGLPLIERVLDEATAALCAEAVGVQRRLLADTVAYAKQRRQFGRAIAEFQVLQHRMADMFLCVEQSAAITAVATLRLNLPSRERGLAVSSAKIEIGRACRFVGQSAVQIHGGVGLTEELAISHYFKRATMIESELGSVSDHLARYEKLWSPAALSGQLVT